MKKIIAANFKSNLTYGEIQNYFNILDSNLKIPQENIFIFPPALALQIPVKNFIKGTQNAYPQNNGAFTGEITLEMLQDIAIKTILIGHSERRFLLAETQEFCKEKFQFFKKAGFKILYCIGEGLEIREKGKSFIEDFLQSQLNGIDLDYPDLIIAYEPIWAIGTGVSASLEDISEVHSFLRSKTDKPLLYGGSVNEKNIADILGLDLVDGVLIGSASLDIQNFIHMIKLSQI